jgi:hypothetical protein
MHIQHYILTGNLLETETPSDAEVERYRSMLETALLDAYPGADIQLVIQQASGAPTATIATTETLADEVDDLAEEVWQEWCATSRSGEDLGGDFDATEQADGSVRYWDVYGQQWHVAFCRGDVSDRVMAALDERDRELLCSLPGRSQHR